MQAERSQLRATVILLVLGAMVMIGAIVIQACCTYRGKPVTRADAEHMKELGMDVQCPEKK